MNKSYLSSIKNILLSSKPSKAIRLLLMVLFVAITPLISFGQCSYPAGATSVGTYAFCIDNSNTITTANVNAGQYALVNVINGYNYTFIVGNVWGANGTQNRENLTLFDASNDTPIGASGYNRGQSGASITWTATISGQIKVLLSKNCGTATTGGTLALTLNSLNNTQDSQTAFGTNTWTGHVYNSVAGASPEPFTNANYAGYYNLGSETISEGFGGDYACFPVLSNGTQRASVYTELFAVRYRMQSTRAAGYYFMNANADDGIRVTVDGVTVLNDWTDHSNTQYCNNLIYLNGYSNIIMDYYENVGGNVVGFNLAPITGNTISSYTDINVCSGNSPGNLNGSNLLSCTGTTNTTYQWQSSTDNVNFTNIVGATSEDYTPLTVTTTSVDIKYYRRVLKAFGVAITASNPATGSVKVTTNPAAPVAPGTITGATTQCAGNTLQTYSIAAVTNATIYNWILPANWTVTAGAGTNNITVSIANNGASNNVSVNAGNGCGTSGFTSKYVTVSAPTVAGTVTPANTNVCSGSNSTNLSLSGNTGSILRWESSTDNFAGGPITTIASTGSPITASNITADTYYRAVVQNGGCTVLNTNSVKLTVVGSMANPGGISINGISYPVNGSTTNCASKTMTFSIPPVANATSYTWTVGTGWTIVSGQGTTSVSVTTGNASQSNNISVYATNGTCPQTGSTYLWVALSNPGTPTGTAAQSFCSGATVANLVATGTAIKWYAASNGGPELAITTVLTNGTHYYATQNPSGCESTSRFDVTATVNSTLTITPNKVDETCSSSNNGSITPALSGGLTNIRYIKLTQKYVNADAWQQVQEIQAFQIFTGTNVALASNGAEATSRSNYSNDVTNYGPQKAIDGDFTSNLNTGFWHSNSTNINEWILVDLKSAKNIDYLRFHNRNSCCQSRGQNMLLELFDASNNLVYSKTIDLWGGVNGAHYVEVNVLDVSWADGATTLNRTALDSGTYTLNRADAVGCSASLPIVIGATSTTPATPIVGTITQPNCTISTGSVVLSGLPSGNWTINPGGISGNTSSTTISGLGAGTYNFTVSIGACTSSATGNVVINAAVTNTWNGSAWSNGTPNNTQKLVFTGNYPPSVDPNVDITGCSCMVTGAATVTIKSGNTLTITNEVAVVGGGNLTFDYDYTFGANPINSGSLLQINNVANSGNIKYLRRTNTKVISTDYTYWSSPVSGQTMYNLSPNTLPSMFYSYQVSATNEDWQQESSGMTMALGLGYIIGGPKVITPPETYLATFTGVPNNGIITLSNIFANKSYLLGNPYPSAIDADLFLNQNATVLGGTLYFWTHNTNLQDRNNISSIAGTGAYAYTSNDYATYNITGGVGIDPGSSTSAAVNPGGNTSIPSGKIAAGQGFFASTQESIPAGSSIVFNNDIRVAGVLSGIKNNAQFFKTKNPESKTANTFEKHRVWLNLFSTQGAFKQTLIGYITDATNEYDSRFDGESFDGNEFVDFYSINQDKNLVIQGRALPFDENDEVPLGYRTTIKGDFTINIDQTDGLLSNQNVFIEDKLTNTVFDLKNGNYTFNTASGTFNDRFVLRFKDKTLGRNDFDVKGNTVLVSIKNKQIKINSFTETIDKVKVYDILGRQLYQNSNVNSNEFLIANLVSSHQTLIVKTSLQNGKTLTDKILY